MVTMSELRLRVDDEFGRISTTPPWANPWDDREPEDAAYSRVTDAAKWHIVGERIDAWFQAIAAVGLGHVEIDVEATWTEPPGPIISRTDRLMPRNEHSIPIVTGRSRLGDIDDAGVIIGVGDPATCVEWFPDCGCDACDRGSDDVIDEIDRHVAGVVNGTFRRLARRAQVITVIDGDGWSAHNMPLGLGDRHDRIERILDNPIGWTELTGPSWLV